MWHILISLLYTGTTTNIVHVCVKINLLTHNLVHLTTYSQLHKCSHTQLSSSSTYAWQFMAPSVRPPYTTALLVSILVKEKLERGGGFVPVSAGDDHSPKQWTGACLIHWYVLSIWTIYIYCKWNTLFLPLVAFSGHSLCMHNSTIMW